MADAKRDNNYVTSLLAVSNSDGITPVVLWADPSTHRLLVSASFPTVYTGEVLTDSGDHQTYTALHTITNIFNLATTNGQYISSTLYTKSGTSIILNSPDANVAAAGLELTYAS